MAKILWRVLICAALGAWPAAAQDEGAPPDTGKAAISGSPTKSGFPSEVVIKGEEGEGNQLKNLKPPLQIDVDPFETIHQSLDPDQSLLLAISPLTVSWRRTHPDVLANPRVIQPWRLAFSQRPGLGFRVRDQLFDILRRRLEPKEARSYGWSLTLADEEGRVFHHYEGSNDPPEELIWNGQNEQGEWIKAGRSYSAVYTFTDPSGSPHTSVGKPILFRGIIHQEETGLHLSLDSSALFGTNKTGSELVKPLGYDLLRSAVDVIKRRFTGIPIAVRVFAATKELAEAQGAVLQDFIIKELMTMSKNVGMEGARAGFSDQRVEIILLNR
ncbi:MAG: hypothetical protein WC881_10785 [Elusimicrobiota bacterium]|jgi:hypothetical protein